MSFNQSAHDAIQQMVDAAAKAHPELGLSFGYIGNIELGGGDYRCWRVFTNRLDDTGRSVLFHLGSTSNLPRMPYVLGQQFPAFIARALTQSRH